MMVYTFIIPYKIPKLVNKSHLYNERIRFVLGVFLNIKTLLYLIYKILKYWYRIRI